MKTLFNIYLALKISLQKFQLKTIKNFLKGFYLAPNDIFLDKYETTLKIYIFFHNCFFFRKKKN